MKTWYGFALQDLIRYLHAYYQAKPIILLDEYDTPIQSAYLNQYCDKAVRLIRDLLSMAFKDNDFLEKATLTGILRVAKEGMFSGLNNVEVYSVFEPDYSEYFGFTEAEVQALLVQSGLGSCGDEVRRWYNGYQVGKDQVYNPWSITHYIKNQGRCAAYWLNTSDNRWIQDLLIRSNMNMKIGLEQSLQGEAIEVEISEQFVFADLEPDDATLWSLLVMAGYLTASRRGEAEEQVNGLGGDADIQRCYLEIPNHEVRATHSRLIRCWLSKDRSEAFYHGLVLGIVVYLLQRGYVIKSNRESDRGRYDIAIIPQDPR